MVVRILQTAALAIALTCPLIAQAQTIWHVDDDNCPGPGSGTEAVPFCRIQDGINAAQDADVIVVSPGAYLENISFLGKAITVRSIDPADPVTVAATIIDGTQDGSVVTFDQGETEDSVLDGLIVMNGYAPLGGGIRCGNSSQPMIRRCMVVDNTATDFGGGLFGGGPTIQSCIIRDNFAANRGGGIFSGSATVINSLIMSNTASTHGGGGIYSSHGRIVNSSLIANTARFGGGMMSPFGSPEIINCLIADNSSTDLGGGLELSHSNATIINCTFTNNTAVTRGGGLYLNFGSPTITNCIFWGDSAPLGPEFHVHASGSPTITYSTMHGGQGGIGGKGSINWGSGNLDLDPWFANAKNGDYRLLTGSPCIDAGDNTAVSQGTSTDLDSNPRFVDDPNTDDTGCGDPPLVDMGAYEVQDPCTDIDGDGRVTICHVPPGNPDNAHTIMVSVNAIPVHVRHGDTCGPCEGRGGVSPDDAPPKHSRSADLNGDDVIDVADLVLLLGAWGSNPRAAADFEGDDLVDVADLIELLASWGACE